MYLQLLYHPFAHSAFHSSFLSSVFTYSPYITLLSFLPSKSLVMFPFLSLFISTFIIQNILLTYHLSFPSFLPSIHFQFPIHPASPSFFHIILLSFPASQFRPFSQPASLPSISPPLRPSSRHPSRQQAKQLLSQRRVELSLAYLPFHKITPELISLDLSYRPAFGVPRPISLPADIPRIVYLSPSGRFYP